LLTREDLQKPLIDVVQSSKSGHRPFHPELKDLHALKSFWMRYVATAMSGRGVKPFFTSLLLTDDTRRRYLLTYQNPSRNIVIIRVSRR
jgi:hypothetical protein